MKKRKGQKKMYFVESEYLENMDFMKTFFQYEQAVKYMKKCYKMEKNKHSWQWPCNCFVIASVRAENGETKAYINNRGTMVIM